MILCIDTTKDHKIEIILRDEERRIAKKKISAKYAQAEKLLPLIDKVLKAKKLKLRDVKEIKVENRGGSPVPEHGTSFTALRIGVVTANALGYALGISVKSEFGIGNLPAGRQGLGFGRKKFSIVEPVYDREPNITKIVHKV